MRSHNLRQQSLVAFSQLCEAQAKTHRIIFTDEFPFQRYPGSTRQMHLKLNDIAQHPSLHPAVNKAAVHADFAHAGINFFPRDPARQHRVIRLRCRPFH